MNITVLCNRDLASNFALNLLLPTLARQHELRVFYSSQVGAGEALLPELGMLKFLEQSLFNELLFPALEGSHRHGDLLGFEGLATALEVPLTELNGVNSERGLALLEEGAPDLVISIRYGGILREQAIALPARGVINLHSGLLPDYRGVMATFRAMARGDETIGTTLHTIIDPGIDTGEIIASSRQLVDYGKSYLWNVLHLYPRGVELLFPAVEVLAHGGSLQALAQPAGGAYYSFPVAEELAAFHRRGLRLYDAQEIIEFSRQYLDSTT